MINQMAGLLLTRLGGGDVGSSPLCPDSDQAPLRSELARCAIGKRHLLN